MGKERCLQKLNELKDRLAFLERHLDYGRFMEDRILRKAIYKEFQEAVEVITDICAIIAKDMGYSIEDDHTNIERVCELLGLGYCGELRRARGLRNVIVHEYNGVIDELAFNSMKELLPALLSFEKEVRAWILKK